MSRAAGIPTGWEIVQDLIRRIAAAEGADLGDHYDQPELWWVLQGRGEPRFETLIAALATTRLARRNLIRQYFEPRVVEGRPAVPTPAHRALAAMCESGRVRLIVTTNFDPLIERALEEVGLAPEVIASPRAVGGMTPLPHTRLTVLKPNGDYATLGLRIGPEDLATYPPRWRSLLRRVFDEFGLLVVGWSAEWDTALAETLAASASRRYPTFWATYRADLTEPARRLIAQRQATIIDTAGADEFLTDITDRLGRLDQVAARRGRPTRAGMHLFAPRQTTQWGWSLVPPLQLRVAATLGPASWDACGMIRRSQRDALVTALRVSPFSSRLHGLALGPPAWVLPHEHAGEAPSQEPLVEWMPTPDHQSSDYALYRLGGDATRGISALIAVSLPPLGVHDGGSATITLDVAISRVGAVRLGEVAALFRDGLVLTTAIIPQVVAAVLPPEAQPERAEIHIQTFPRAENGVYTPGAPGGSLPDLVDLASLGAPPEDVGTSWGFAAQVAGPLVEKEAAQLAVDGIEGMALSHGFLGSDAGVASLRQELGLPAV
jgi:hypothetical protein